MKKYFFISSLLLAGNVFSDDKLQLSERFNMGFYFDSINEIANRTDIEVSLNFWAKDLLVTEAVRRNLSITKSSAILFDSIEDMQKAFDNSELDVIIAPPLLISRYFKREDLADGFAGVQEGKRPEKLLLIVRNDKNINNIVDLHGKRLAILENDELADIFLDTLTLKSLKLSFDKTGSTIHRYKKNNRIVLDLFFDKEDVGVVYNSAYEVMVELNPDIKNKIKILAEFPLKSKNFSYFRRSYPYTEVLTSIAMGFANDARGKQILDIFKTPEIDYCKVEDLNSFDKLYSDYLQLKKQKK